MNLLFHDSDSAKTREFKGIVKEAKVAKTAEACINIIQTEDVWNVVFLPDSEQVADWIIANQPQIRHIIVHSETQGIVDRLADAKYSAVGVPFDIMKQNLENLYG